MITDVARRLGTLADATTDDRRLDVREATSDEREVPLSRAADALVMELAVTAPPATELLVNAEPERSPDNEALPLPRSLRAARDPRAMLEGCPSNEDLEGAPSEAKSVPVRGAKDPRARRAPPPAAPSALPAVPVPPPLIVPAGVMTRRAPSMRHGAGDWLPAAGERSAERELKEPIEAAPLFRPAPVPATVCEEGTVREEGTAPEEEGAVNDPDGILRTEEASAPGPPPVIGLPLRRSPPRGTNRGAGLVPAEERLDIPGELPLAPGKGLTPLDIFGDLETGGRLNERPEPEGALPEGARIDGPAYVRGCMDGAGAE